VLFHDRMAPTALDAVREKLLALEDDFLSVHPGASVQRMAQLA
jgi:hypothetical protein